MLTSVGKPSELCSTINNPTDYVSEEAREEAKKKLAEMEKSGQIPA